MASVTLADIRKSYGGTQVIHGLSIDIKDGEFIVIVGPSGCGKSTLLRMVAGLEEISGGLIRIGEREVNKLEPKDRDIAMVFQNYALYPHMTVYQNMAYGLKMRSMPKAEIDKRVREAAEILHLSQLLDRRPKQLSGGQRQRVAMGRAMVRDPAAFLFDEPLSNLDAKLRVAMRMEIKRLQRRLGVTSIYVTHDQVEAMTMADRLIVMNAGRAEQIGTPIEIYEKPATTFVAGFIGSPTMNMLPGRITDNGVAITGDIALPLAKPANDHAGRDVIVGIRPEHIDRASPEKALFHLSIEMVEPLGADTLVHGRLNGSDHAISVRLRGNAMLAEGEKLPVTVQAEAEHLFDKESGQRID